MAVVLDQSAFQERLERAVTGGAANQLDAGAGNRLPVGNDGQHLECRPRKWHRPLIAQIPLDRLRNLRCGDQLQFFRVALDREPEWRLLQQVRLRLLQPFPG